MRILFQGDSITDAGRDRRNYYHMGAGYPKFAAENIRAAHPDADIEFINLGISGNRTDQLFDRMTHDIIYLQPDIVSILIGVNDVWHRYGWEHIMTTDAQIKLNYRCILEAIKRDTTAKIVMMAPFMLDDDKEEIRQDLHKILPAIYELGEEFADVFIPLDRIFAEALKTQPEAQYYSRDGVHLNPNGAAFVGKLWADAVRDIL